MGADYVAFGRILCRFLAYLRNLASPWNRIQDKYNQNRYKAENQNCVCWNILGSYKICRIIHFVGSIKQHKSIDTDINFHIKHNTTSIIDLNIGK